MKPLSLLLLFALPLHADIKIAKNYDFSKKDASLTITTKEGSLNNRNGKLHFDGNTWLTLPSGIRQNDNFGFEVVTSFDVLEQFGFVCSLTGTEKENQGIGILMDDPNPNSPGQFDIVGVLSSKGYFGGFKASLVEPNQIIHLAVIVQNGECSLYFNGKEQRRIQEAIPVGTLSTLNLGAHVFDAPEKGLLQGSIYHIRTFTFAPGNFSSRDLLAPKSKSTPRPKPTPPATITKEPTPPADVTPLIDLGGISVGIKDES